MTRLKRRPHVVGDKTCHLLPTTATTIVIITVACYWRPCGQEGTTARRENVGLAPTANGSVFGRGVQLVPHVGSLSRVLMPSSTLTRLKKWAHRAGRRYTIPPPSTHHHTGDRHRRQGPSCCLRSRKPCHPVTTTTITATMMTVVVFLESVEKNVNTTNQGRLTRI